MKHSVLFALLLGLGLTAPLTCTKEKDKKSSEQKHQQKNPVTGSKKMVLGAPVNTIKSMGQGRA